MPKKIFTEKEKEEIIFKYTIEKIGSKPLSQEYGCSAPTLLKNLKEWGIEPNQKKLDLTNQQFGFLKALKPAQKRNDKYTRWICECKCGNVIEVRTDYLTSKHTTSCGCQKNIYFKKTIVLNKKYGKLTPILFNELKQQYLCECECGNKIYVEGYNLATENTQSCGCLKSKGELKINTLLSEMNINYKTQYSFEDCRFPDSNRLAYFDYAIFDKNNSLIGLIEYDGLQHTAGWMYKQDSLEKIQQHDSYKNEYCLKNNIYLKRISYKDLNNINIEYLTNIIQEFNK